MLSTINCWTSKFALSLGTWQCNISAYRVYNIYQGFFLEQKLITKFIHSVVHSKLHIKKVILNTLNSIKILTLQCSMTSKYRINTVLVKLNGDYMSSSILNFYCDIKHTLHDFEDDITACFSRWQKFIISPILW